LKRIKTEIYGETYGKRMRSTPFEEKDQIVIIKSFTEIYGEPFTVLVHLIHLRLKFNGNNFFG
jgi:hypothetical protein